jgi:hypothetical protein
MAKPKSAFLQDKFRSKNRLTAIATLSAFTVLSLAPSASRGEEKGIQGNFEINPNINNTVIVTGQRLPDPIQHQKLPVDTTGFDKMSPVVVRHQDATPDNGNGNNNQNPNAENKSGSNTGNTGNNGDKTAKDDANKKPGKERCDASQMLGKRCEETYNWIDNANLINQVGQAGGAATVNTTGQLNTIKAQTAGTQTAVMEAAAKTQQNAGMLQTTMGLANAGMGIYQIMLSRQHKAINTNELKPDLANSQTDPTKNAQTIKQAINEQSSVESAAMAAGVRSTIIGVQQTLGGILSMGAAKQAKEMAGKLSDTTGTSYQLTSTNPDTGTLNPTTSTSINPGTATDPAVASQDGNVASTDVPTISPPLNPDATAGGPGSGPAAGSFQSGNKNGGGGAAGNPSIGVGSMSPAKGEQEQTAARMADNKANTSYGQAGGYAATAGGVSAEKSADLGFLANLLPKPQEEMGKNGILDYGGGRSPASMAPYSFLGKDVNIFQRISDRTTAKLKSGDLKSDLGS